MIDREVFLSEYRADYTKFCLDRHIHEQKLGSEYHGWKMIARNIDYEYQTDLLVFRNIDNDLVKVLCPNREFDPERNIFSSSFF